MGYPDKAKWIAPRAASIALRYGLALASVAVALGLAYTFLYLQLPQPFTALALSAIAITFWYGGTKPGILAALLSSFARSYFFEPEVITVPHVLYDLVFLIFALRRPNVLPVGDLGVRSAIKRAYRMRALPTPKQMEKIAKKWHPYSSIAAWYLWRSLESQP